MDKSRLQSITITLLLIGQIITNIRMSSYSQDMNSLWESQVKINQGFHNRLNLLQELLKEESELFHYIFEEIH